MTTTEDLLSQDGGPLERNHMRDMVHKNAVEDVAYERLSKHLETQRKAFVRQNTRDEEEMRTLLCRLQTEQQMPALEDEDSDFDGLENISDEENHMYDEENNQSANPYPVTIVPKFPANQPKRSGSKKGINIPESSRSNARRISSEFEEVQDSMSSLTISQMSPPVGSYNSALSATSNSTSRDETLGDWLATPDAISSVRRNRKTVSEQAARKNLIRTNSEVLPQDSSSVSSFPALPRFRSNSLKDRRKQSLPKEGISQNRRSGSVKEKKASVDDSTEPRRKTVIRSHSMLTRSALAEFNLRQEMKANKLPLDKNNDVERYSENTHGNGARKSENQSVTRKASNNTNEDNANRKANIAGKKSPARSPLAAQGKQFKF